MLTCADVSLEDFHQTLPISSRLDEQLGFLRCFYVLLCLFFCWLLLSGLHL